MSAVEKIEILSLEIFSTHKEEIDGIERLKKEMNKDIGWHYHLDLAWMLREISRLPKGSLILDAGAGNGLAQFMLAAAGYNVISTDFMRRKNFGIYSDVTHYLNDQDEDFDNRYTRHIRKLYNIPIGKRGKDLLRKVPLLLMTIFRPVGARVRSAMSIIERYKHLPGGKSTDGRGSIFVYQCDLRDMALLPDELVDGVVSISALEHNDHRDLGKCMDEILRVTKPGGVMAMTVSASQTGDWFHEPSKGWCYSEESLRKLFRLREDAASNFSQKDRLYDELKKENNELHKRLAPFYFKSGNNGMPWGKWDPRYQPVGVLKLKELADLKR